MAVPTTRFRVIPQTTPAAAVDTPSERLAAVAGEIVVSNGVGNEVDFGTVDIGGGAKNSTVKTLLWDVTADGGNTTVETVKLWMSHSGFDQAGTVIKIRPLSGADQLAPTETENYAADAVVGDYTWDTMPESEPGASNLFPTDEGASMALNTTSDDAVLWAMFLAVAADETEGDYFGIEAGAEFRFSLKFAYS